MRKHCCGIGEKDNNPRAEHISEILTRLLEGVKVMSSEMEDKFNQIKNCPAPCDDGMVDFSIVPGEIRKIPCTIITSQCQYGNWM